MSKDWICYGWTGTFCHTALNFFASEKDGACYKLPDQDYEEETYPFTLYYAVVHHPTSDTLNRKIVSYFNDKPFDSMDVKNSWNYAWISYDINDHTNDGKYGFELQDENGNVLCSASCYVGTKPTETPTPTPQPEDLTDYDRIKDIIDSSNSLTALPIKRSLSTVKSGIGYSTDELSKEISSHTDEIETKIKTVNENVKSLSSSFEDKFNLDDGVFTRYLNDIKHDIDNINFPDLSGLSNSVEDVKTAISNITFPDLTGLSSTIDNVKLTLDNLSFPTLNQISGVLNGVKDDLTNDITSISRRITDERNNIFQHIDSKITTLDTGLSSLIRSVKTDLSNMDVPDAASVFESFSSVESKIDGLEFPTLKNIEDSIINTAESIAEKILNKLLDAIERRYEK